MIQAQSEPPGRRDPDHGDQQGLPLRPDRLAIFLDVDGTLLDIAATPDGIVVPDELPNLLALLHERLGGALALVSGRGLAYLRRLFPRLGCAMAGLHGAEVAGGPGTEDEARRSPSLEAAKRDLAAFASDWPGVVVEDKGAAFAAHFRQAPQFAAAVEERMVALAAGLGDAVTMQRGKSVIEIRPSGHDKGTALKFLMARPPFEGRIPVAIGDDLTDEAMFAAAVAMGGSAAKVGPGETSASIRVASPADVRAWIGRMAR